jgi:hypothetical protein
VEKETGSMKYSPGEIERADSEVVRAIHALKRCTEAREKAARELRSKAEQEATAEEAHEKARAKAQAMRAANGAVS